jgi:hypothetical protein
MFGINNYMDKFGGENFHAWKLKMILFLRRNEQWSLVNGNEFISRTPAMKVQRNLEGEIRVHVFIQSIITNWKKIDQSTLSTIAYYLTDEPLQ